MPLCKNVRVCVRNFETKVDIFESIISNIPFRSTLQHSAHRQNLNKDQKTQLLTIFVTNCFFLFRKSEIIISLNETNLEQCKTKNEEKI